LYVLCGYLSVCFDERLLTFPPLQLMEAMDVLQRQVDDYENEIRSLKDFKSPGRSSRNAARTPSRRTTGLTGHADRSPHRGDDIASSGALEATVFRPALQKALLDAAKWKSMSMASALGDLSPLQVPLASGAQAGQGDSSADNLLELTTALCSYRRVKATTTLIDLTKRGKTPRMQLRESNERKAAAVDRVQSLVYQCQSRTLY
jgi:hypothetical protein